MGAAFGARNVVAIVYGEEDVRGFREGWERVFDHERVGCMEEEHGHCRAEEDYGGCRVVGEGLAF